MIRRYLDTFALFLSALHACAPLPAFAEVNVTVNNTTYAIPETGERGWGAKVTQWIQAISNNTLQPSGGTFTLSADVDFGATYGLKPAYIKSRTSNPATVGLVRFANIDTLAWRNAANDGNILLGVDTSNRLTYNGNPRFGSSLLTASRALISDAAGTVGVSDV